MRCECFTTTHNDHKYPRLPFKMQNLIIGSIKSLQKKHSVILLTRVNGPQDSLSFAQLLPRFVEFHRVLSLSGVLQINGVDVLKTSNRLKEHLRKVNTQKYKN